jgi:hypothetical protein
MPNWCNNTLTLTHEDPAMILRAKEALDRGEFLSEFIPVPEDLKIVAGSVGDPDEQKELERKTAENREKYGYGNWYDFCVGAWGTKWDVGGDGQTDIHPDGKMLHTPPLIPHGAHPLVPTSVWKSWALVSTQCITKVVWPTQVPTVMATMKRSISKA